MDKGYTALRMATYAVKCPFVRDTYTQWDEDGAADVPTWRPGVDWEPCAPDEDEAVADGIGQVLYTVIDVHEPPRPYHPRVYFIREWIDPDGKRFGRKNLRIMGIQAFKRRLQGYRFRGYENGFRMREAARLNDAERVCSGGCNDG